MDTLEKIMRDNKELFLDQEPAQGHAERFEKKLNRENRKIKVVRLTTNISKVAAIGILLLMSSLWVYNEFTEPTDQSMRLGDVNPELRKVEYYFTSQINSQYQKLQTDDILPDHPAYQESLLAELDQMDSVYTQLQKELGAHPNDERIIQAMIRHYQTKLQVMTEILEKLRSYQEINDSQSNNQNQYESVKL